MTHKNNQLLHNKNIQYALIVLYGLIVVFIIKWGGLYGSSIDWLSQHTVYPDIFRQHYYETGNILPKFFFNTGAGQNAFNLAYYGLLSPLILFSYLLPTVNMITYIAVTSVILYLLTGVLTKKFVSSHLGGTTGFWASIIVLSMAPLNFHFHTHIMFVWHFPFLILGFIGIDKYFAKNKPGMFVISTAVLIFVNYLYAVPCLMALYIYGVYKIFKQTEAEFCFKTFLKKIIAFSFVIAIPVMISGVLLVPTAQSLIANSRPADTVATYSEMLIPEFEDFFYSGYSIGITVTMFIAIIGNLTCKNLKKSDRFLNISLLVLIFCPIIIFALNGFLYARGKMLIPFAILYVYNLFIFTDNLKNNRVNIKLTTIITLLSGIVLCFSGSYSILIKSGFFLAVILELTAWRKSLKNIKAIPIYTTVVCLVISVFVYHSDITVNDCKNRFSEAKNLVQSIDDKGFYRTTVSYEEYDNTNKVYNNRHNNSAFYSSTYNPHYANLYINRAGNNFYHNCKLVATGARNELFHSFMGTRYIVSDIDPGFMYEKIEEGKKLNLYENKNYYPVAYKSNSLMSEKEFDKAEFPYSLGYLMNKTITDTNIECDYKPEFDKINVGSEYTFSNKNNKQYQIDLGKEYVGKYLYLTFDVDNTGKFKNEKDIYISINGCKNTLTRYWHVYYNANTNFEFVIPLENDAILDIDISKGDFNIKNLKMYTSQALHTQYEAVNDFKVDKKNYSFSCTTHAKAGEYFVTTIPFDTNFKAYVNGKEAEIVMVNKAFMGLKLTDGKNNIRFEYKNEFCTLGYIVSIAGIVMFAILIIFTVFKNRKAM